MALQDERLYYAASYLTDFSSVVTGVQERNGETWVRLKETAFYPTSGGQPYDTGTMTATTAAQDAQSVTAVEVVDEQVWHCVSGSLEVGQSVTGRIDWARRFDFMQQHNGQHILSACFADMLGAATTSFHMGDTYSTIDLDIASLSDADAARVLLEANRWIWRDAPIHARFVSEVELAAMKLPKAPSVTEDIRIVTIQGLEDNACGGTHPASTGQVGQILITKTERMRGGVRVTFVCGERALTAGSQAVGTVRALATGFSVGTAEVPDAFEALTQQFKESQRKYDIVRDRYMSLVARGFAENHVRHIGGTLVLFAAISDLDDVQDLKRLALSASAWLEGAHLGGAQLVIFIGELGGRTHLVVQATDGAAMGADAVIKAVLPPLNGKGGGNAKAAQGSAPASINQVSEQIESAIAALQPSH